MRLLASAMALFLCAQSIPAQTVTDQAILDFRTICLNEMPSVAAANKRANEQAFAPVSANSAPKLFKDISQRISEVSGAATVLSKTYGASSRAFLGAGRAVVGSERSSNCLLALYSSDETDTVHTIETRLRLGSPVRTAFQQSMSITLWQTSVNGFEAAIRLSETTERGKAKKFDLALFVFD
ncbi:MAG: hypothetical protein N4A70_00615 [Pelagimonas sp.]|jgi:hypothetical protein|nr:hypothetical protein [Pelagimonas sp.]